MSKTRRNPAETVCDLLELADHRALANDGPVGNGSDCFNELTDYEKRRFYLACKKLRHIAPKHGQTDEKLILGDIVIRGLSAKIKKLESNLAPTLALMDRLAALISADINPRNEHIFACPRGASGAKPGDGCAVKCSQKRKALTDYKAHKNEQGS